MPESDDTQAVEAPAVVVALVEESLVVEVSIAGWCGVY